MADHTHTAQRASLLFIFGMMFTTVSLGVLLPLIAAVLAVRDPDVDCQDLFRWLR